jgi:cytochrome c oxidase subunit 3
MSQTTPDSVKKEGTAAHSAPPAGHHAEDHGHGGHGHGHAEYPFLAHHFDTPQQQFDAGKLGVWLFLLTEVLFFAGLFVAYSVYRAMRPEVFVYAHYHLDTNLGAVNTCVLLISSLTAAWAVRNAQLRQKTMLVANIVITIACACTFMVVKYFEYSHKVHDGLLWGPNFAPKHQVYELPIFKEKHPEAAAYAQHLIKRAEEKKKAAANPPPAGVKPEPVVERTPTREEVEPLLAAGMIGPKAHDPEGVSYPRNAHVFFSIYFFMTGLHGLHVVIGIGIFVWLLIRATKGVFGPQYFGPIDYAALYWHLVDLIWIYLFPLLYLIH